LYFGRLLITLVSMATFNSLPWKLRDMVYGLLLFYENPVPITSPCPRHKCHPTHLDSRPVKVDSPKDFANLSRASKQVNAEVSVVFYSRNTFLVSNDVYHSPHLSNVHAIRTFKQRTPPEKIRLIRRIQFHMVIHPFNGTSPALSDVQSISRSLEKHFHGIESVGLNRHPCEAKIPVERNAIPVTPTKGPVWLACTF
jgi:hypothetical protein